MIPEGAVSTVDILKAGWPIVVGLAGSVAWLTGVAIMAKNTKDDFMQFKNRDYVEDKNSMKFLIGSIKEYQEKVEEKLEAKLDRMSERSDAHLDKVYGEINKISTLLAELKGRFESRSWHEEKPTNPKGG